MGLLRSEDMSHGMLVLPVQDARKYVDQIGKEVNIQFEDMNARDMRRPFRKHIQRIDEMERILRFIGEEVGRIEGCTVQKNHVNEFLAADEAGTYKLDTLEAELAQLYQHFLKFKDNNSTLMDQRNHAVEEAEVAIRALKIFSGSPQQASSAATADEEGLGKPLMGREEGGGRLGHVSGVVPRSDEARFARAVFRASQSNAYTQFFPIEGKVTDPKTGISVMKSVFVIYFQGDGGYLHQKIVKVCNAFGVNMYAWPFSLQKARERNDVLQQALTEKEGALRAYQNVMRAEAAELLRPVGENCNSRIEDWRLFCVKEKSIYSILNLCQEGMMLRVDVWFPSTDRSKIEELLKSVNANSQQEAMLCVDKGSHAKSVPPTFIRTNEYTEPFQEVINTYGFPSYKEANPALLTVVTFPFIFGMMYGDVGHGSMLFCAGLWMCWNAESLRYTQPALFMARYMVVSLGFFAVFAGFMYNDMFSIGLQLFDSRFEDLNGDGHYTPKATFDPTNSGGGGPYPFGLDWAWQNSSNELLFVNSLKMKLSVLFGVLQMIVGVLLRWGNALHSRNLTDFIFECIPMMVFMICFFGWMDAMILYKWTHPIDNAPSIINSLICMAMGQEDKNPLWDGSVQLAQSLMKYTVCAVPFMLLPKPFILLWQHKKAQGKVSNDEEAVVEASGHGHGHGEEFAFDEVFIHQIIETIEYVLGTVSHTASYLRIWALSLAHQQLSMVFFQKTLQNGLEMPYPINGIVLYLLFAAWFGVTVGVLLGMDVLECFLHTLRLHWVEFQSKFYKAGGVMFAPYRIRSLMEAGGDE